MRRKANFKWGAMKKVSALVLPEVSNQTQISSSSSSSLSSSSCRRTSSFKSSVDRNSLSSTGSSSNSEEGVILSLIPHNSQLLHNSSVLETWLISIQFEEYIPLFISSGYDMPTISRMTPADLTAIGITKPLHRRKLKNEISKLNLSDGIPNYIPKSFLEWLKLIRLDEYFDTLCQQKYDSIDRVIQLTWEDLEEIGIKKLGHQKRLMLAIKRILDLKNGTHCCNNYTTLPTSAPSSSSLSSESSSTSFPEVNHLPLSQNFTFPLRTYPNQICQEVAINTSNRVKATVNSPTIDNPTNLELKTFQQLHNNESINFNKYKSPIKSSNKNLSSANSLPNTFDGFKLTSQLNNRRSYESLSKQSEESESSKITAYLQQYMSRLQKQDPFSFSNSHEHVQLIPEINERRASLQDYESSYESLSLNYDYKTIATLNRPRSLIKNKPIAKIIAKSRQDDATCSLGKKFEHGLINDEKLNHTVDQISEDETWALLPHFPNSSNKIYEESQEIKKINDGQPNDSAFYVTGIYSTLKKQKIPPPPPKRTNSMKTNSTDYCLFNGFNQNSEQSSLSSRASSLETMQDTAFATCVKNLTSRFSVPNPDIPPLHGRNYKVTSKSLLPSYSDENFPPPPSPLPHISYEGSGDNFIYPEQKFSTSSLTPSSSIKNNLKQETTSNTSLKDKKNLSTNSSNESMPFTNDNIDTIKQKVFNEEKVEINSSKQTFNPLISHSSSTPSISSFRSSHFSNIAPKTSTSPSDPNLSIKNLESFFNSDSKNQNINELSISSPTIETTKRKQSSLAPQSTHLIEDIETMLSNLSNQLDALLESEMNEK